MAKGLLMKIEIPNGLFNIIVRENLSLWHGQHRNTEISIKHCFIQPINYELKTYGCKCDKNVIGNHYKNIDDAVAAALEWQIENKTSVPIWIMKKGKNNDFNYVLYGTEEDSIENDPFNRFEKESNDRQKAFREKMNKDYQTIVPKSIDKTSNQLKKEKYLDKLMNQKRKLSSQIEDLIQKRKNGEVDYQRFKDESNDYLLKLKELSSKINNIHKND